MITDEELAVELSRSSGKRPAPYPVGELLARHWAAVFSYARLCTSGPEYAGILTTAAFTRLFGETLRQTGPTAAWRPQALVTVRRIAGEWDGEKRRTLLHPGLRSTPEDGERVAVRLLPAENRRLVSRAFQRLPERARCVLWHAEVEAEDLAVPAGLLGLEPADAPGQLERAHALLRDGCLRAHRELAPDEECRRFNRLLDVSLRRGDAGTDPDLRRHMAGCAHCRYAADQLDHSDGRLAVLLADAVLGWGAQAYLDSRPGRTGIVEARSTPREPGDRLRPPAVPAEPGSGPRHAVRAAQDATRRSPRRLHLALAVLAVSGCVLVPLILWSGGDDGPAHGGSTSATPTTGTAPGAQPSGIGAGGFDGGALKGRLRNADSGLCVTVSGSRLKAGAEAVLATCTASARQQWSYESDGLLRSLDDSDLCLDSHLGFSVRLADCANPKGTGRLRYDFTVQGNLLPRSTAQLALAPTSDENRAELVLKPRTNEASESWSIDTSVSSLRMESITSRRTGDSAKPPSRPQPSPSRIPSPKPTPRPSASPSPSQPTYPAPYPTANWCYSYSCWPYGYGGYGYGGNGYGGYGYGGYGYGGYGYPGGGGR